MFVIYYDAIIIIADLLNIRVVLTNIPEIQLKSRIFLD